jgi:hypothetical protein
MSETSGIAAAIARIEAAFPGKGWVLASGKLSAGEPQYGCVIADDAGEPIGEGEDDDICKAVDDAIASARIYFEDHPQEAYADPDRLRDDAIERKRIDSMFVETRDEP